MVALAKDRNTVQRPGDEFDCPVAASTKIFGGAIVMLDASGNAVQGKTATGLKPGGRAEEFVDNADGAAGDKQIRIRKGVFLFENAGDIDRSDITATAYVVDDQTVSSSSSSSSRSALGTIADVDADGVWVRI